MFWAETWEISDFFIWKFSFFLVVKCSVYLNSRVFVMYNTDTYVYSDKRSKQKIIPSPLDSILDAVLTVSPNKQYLGILRPTTPAQADPEGVGNRIIKSLQIHFISDGSLPSGHMTFIQRCINADATSWGCIDIDMTLSQRCVLAG